jgi:RNA polymerase sigma-70 factor (ECF subfamily)
VETIEPPGKGDTVDQLVTGKGGDEILIEAVFLAERGRILASLIRLARNFDDAEDVLGEALLEAQEHWTREGLPENAGAWLLTVAKRKLLDRRRVEARRRELLRENAPLLLTDEESAEETADDVLRLIFTCCHPVLPAEARIALTLRTLGGLTTAEIARAFLVDETAMAQRLVRAKKKIALAGVRYGIPGEADMAERLESVLHVIYLIFNEGYSATAGDALARRDLCVEALRLAALLRQWLPGVAEVEGLEALLALIHARREARVDERGRLVTLDRQDRAKWRREEIVAASVSLQNALRRKCLGPYQLQAAIMAVHTEAERAEQTDWRQIRLLYEALFRFDASATVRLNHAVAVAYADGWTEAEPLLAGLGELDDYYPYHAARASCALALGRVAEARAAFQRALGLTRNAVEREYLTRRLAEAR